MEPGARLNCEEPVFVGDVRGDPGDGCFICCAAPAGVRPDMPIFGSSSRGRHDGDLSGVGWTSLISMSRSPNNSELVSIVLALNRRADKCPVSISLAQGCWEPRAISDHEG